MTEPELHLSEVLIRVKTSSSRKKALEDLKHLFSHNQATSNPSLTALKDKVWHSICEVLFQLVSEERSKWLQKKVPTENNTSTARLRDLASVIRVVVNAGVRKFRSKTLNAVLDHIIQTLDVPDQSSTPVSLDYLKCLNAVLAYQPHTEHLRDKWTQVVDFVLQQIERILGTIQFNSSVPPASPSHTVDLPSRSPHASTHPSTSSSGRPRSSLLNGGGSGRSGFPPASGKEFEELIICIRHLVRATNADVISHAERIILAVEGFLLAAKSPTRAHPDAFVVLIEVLGRVNTTSIRVTKDAALRLVKVIQDSWSFKSIRNEMLALLVLVKDYISAKITDQSPDPSDLKGSVGALVDTWFFDLAGRPERDLLQLDDLEFLRPGVEHQNFFRVPTLRLREATDRAEASWAVVRLSAVFSASLDEANSRFNVSSNGEGPRKRARISSRMQDLLDRATSEKGSAQISALQVLAFSMYACQQGIEFLQRIMTQLDLLVVHRDSKVSSWAMISLASAAAQSKGSDLSLQPMWLQIHASASKAVSQPGTSRAAAYLLSTLALFPSASSQGIGVNLIQGNSESAGPEQATLLSDATCSFWLAIWQSQTPNARSRLERFAETAIHWLFKVWMPSDFENQVYATQILSTSTSRDILQFMHCFTGRDSADQLLQSFDTLASIGQVSERVAADQRIIDYLLLISKAFKHKPLPLDSATRLLKGARLSKEIRARLAQKLISRLTIETKKTHDAWQDVMRDRPHVISIHMTRLLGTLILINHALHGEFGHNDSDSAELQSANFDLVSSLLQYISATTKNKLHSNAMKDVLSTYLPACHTVLDSRNQNAISQIQLPPMLLDLSQIRLQSHKTSSLHTPNFEDSDDDIDTLTGQSQMEVNNRGLDLARDITGLRNAEISRVNALNGYIELCTIVQSARDTTSSDTEIMRGFIAYLTQLSPDDMITSVSLIEAVLTQAPPVTLDDLELLLEHLSTIFLGSYEFERHEVAQMIVLHVLQSYSHVWSLPESGSLHDTAAQIYEWFVDTTLKADVCSRRVKYKISQLLMTLLTDRGPEYAPNSSASIRTVLFSMLKDSDLNVVFYILRAVHPLFSHYVLGEHEAIFNELQDALPSDASFHEGILIRLYALSQLGSRWQTLLRRCSYHIFEIAGVVPTSDEHASQCMLNVSDAYNFASPRGIFDLFGPQMIFTWSQHQSLGHIPFNLFLFDDQAALLRDCEGEAYAQCMMTARSDETDFLCSVLNTTSKDLLERHFGQATAYCVAEDIDSSASSAPLSNREEALRNMLGKEKYKELMKKHLHQAIGITMYTFEENIDAMVKQFEKRTANRKLTQALHEMVQDINASKQLPGDTQPVFRVNRLLDRIERLCRRADVAASEFWNPSTYTFVLRILLDRVHPALGPLQACATIRKIRVLIALAGSVPCAGYSLEMSLHALRPFILDQQSVDESLGVIRYLFQHGVDHLASNLEFTAGFVVCLLLNTRSFLRSNIESTTQESEHKESKSHVEKIRKFISGEWLETVSNRAAGKHTQRQIEAFRTFISVAAEVLENGNARQSSPEGRLLHLCFEDQYSNRRILKGFAYKEVISLLVTDFDPPSSVAADMYGSQSSARKYAQVVRQTCSFPSISKEYLIWASKVVGRAYMCSGLSAIQSTKRPERSVRQARNPEDNSSDLGIESQRAILQSLLTFLGSNRSSECGLTENAIRTYLTASSSGPDRHGVGFLPQTIIEAMSLPVPVAAQQRKSSVMRELQDAMSIDRSRSDDWILNVSLALTSPNLTANPVLLCINSVLSRIPELHHELFGPILHLVLLQEHGRNPKVKDLTSAAFNDLFRDASGPTGMVRVVISAIIYLQSQIVPNEMSINDRYQWLELDRIVAAQAAARCGLHTASLFFLEQRQPELPVDNRRTSRSVPAPQEPPPDLLLNLYREIDEPDSFYGVKQQPGLQSVISRLDYEGATMRSLSFRGSVMDSQMRFNKNVDPTDTHHTLLSMTNLNMNSITSAVLSSGYGDHQSAEQNSDIIFKTAMKLEQWDLDPSIHQGSNVSLQYEILQALNLAQSRADLKENVRSTLLKAVSGLNTLIANSKAARSSSALLGIMTEMDDLLSFEGQSGLLDHWRTIEKYSTWMRAADVASVMDISNVRERFLSSLSQRGTLQQMLNITPRVARELEVQNLLFSCRILKELEASSEVLAASVHLSNLVAPSASLDMDIDAQARYQMAGVLWDQEESAMSIRMLQELEGDTVSQKTNTVSRSRLLALLGHHAAEAKAANPDEIMDLYLRPAIKELQGKYDTTDAGHVTHEFAVFCDNQLRDPDLLAEFERAKKMRYNRSLEVEDYTASLRAMKPGTARDRVKRDHKRASTWYKLDDNEFRRLSAIRESFVTQALENYLISLAACDHFDLSILRFFALWLEHDGNDTAVKAVGRHIGKVSSHKFILLMNQLSSRLQSTENDFQRQLFKLLSRMCTEHPYHTMHHVFAGTHPSSGVKDAAAASREAATARLASNLRADKRASKTWVAIYRADTIYHKLAIWKDESLRTGKTYSMDKYATSMGLLSVKDLNVPPATLNVQLRADGDYSKTPTIAGWKSTMSIANGLSQPKIVTAIGTDGQNYKQLMKSGNDDLRQDAIMEQVFDQVSDLLRNQTATRQRNLHVRTYKVLPLSASSGIMEFVQNTVALLEYLQPAHAKYYPKDHRWNTCRNMIHECADSPVDNRVKVFRDACKRFQPVMRYFFFERFQDPDEWFAKRLAYTRSTATISILGHILGLGDRHCHNILLDEKSGEVVHIDLGVAFEAGRVLPIPEVVPFRLTRDIVDAMGINKVEGVFRRCCEFTLEALRQERGSIMTLLNVLRYDPLYSWSVSPLRAKRMQESNLEGAVPGGTAGTDDVANGFRDRKHADMDDEGEAARALGIVEKKLSKTLSVTAAVSELIQQASDERNLAVLYCGWGAWA